MKGKGSREKGGQTQLPCLPEISKKIHDSSTHAPASCQVPSPERDCLLLLLLLLLLLTLQLPPLCLVSGLALPPNHSPSPSPMELSRTIFFFFFIDGATLFPGSKTRLVFVFLYFTTASIQNNASYRRSAVL